MIRGEFQCGDGLKLPNNVTDFGCVTLLNLALRNSDDYTFFVGLCTGVYDHALQIESLTEPTIGHNGYVRKSVTRDAAGWPNIGNLNGESFFGTDFLTWTAAGGPFDKAITRMFICGDNTLVADMPIFALSAALPAPVTIAVATPLANRQFKYNLYLR